MSEVIGTKPNDIPKVCLCDLDYSFGENEIDDEVVIHVDFAKQNSIEWMGSYNLVGGYRN